jgi:hypothetical protein
MVRKFYRQIFDHHSRSIRTGTVISDIAKSRAEIEGARLLVLSAALQIDKFKAKVCSFVLIGSRVIVMS